MTDFYGSTLLLQGWEIGIEVVMVLLWWWFEKQDGGDDMWLFIRRLLVGEWVEVEDGVFSVVEKVLMRWWSLVVSVVKKMALEMVER